ncbi:MAG: hypothetical protein HKL80_01910 [Acidimicrobiales bacterium]|nr:hypothetical protein [Acidimicrobiales bacterium]
MQLRKKTAIAAVFLMGLGLSACSANSSPNAASTSNPVRTTISQTVTSPTSSTAPPPNSANSGINDNTLNQINQQLNSLDRSMSQANQDVTNPQGDN